MARSTSTLLKSLDNIDIQEIKFFIDKHDREKNNKNNKSNKNKTKNSNLPGTRNDIQGNATLKEGGRQPVYLLVPHAKSLCLLNRVLIETLLAETFVGYGVLNQVCADGVFFVIT